MSGDLANTSHVHISFIPQAFTVCAWSDIAQTQQSAKKRRSRHLAARAARARAHLRALDRRSPGGEAPREVERAPELPHDADRARLESTHRADIDSPAPRFRRSPPHAAPRCSRSFAMKRKRSAHIGAPRHAHNSHGYTSVAAIKRAAQQVPSVANR